MCSNNSAAEEFCSNDITEIKNSMDSFGIAEKVTNVCACFLDNSMTEICDLSTVIVTHLQTESVVVSPCTLQVSTVTLTDTPSWCNTTALEDREIIVYSIFTLCIGLCVLFGLIAFLSCLYIKKKSKTFTPHGKLYVLHFAFARKLL